MRGEDGAFGVTRRAVRLLVLLGVAVGVYVVLSFFSHAARADTGSIGHIGATDPVASVQATAADARQAASEPKSLVPKSLVPTSTAPKPTAPKAQLRKTHRPTIKTAGVGTSGVQASEKTSAPKTRKSTTAQSLTTPALKEISSTTPALKKIQGANSPAGGTIHRVQVRTTQLRQPAAGVVRTASRARAAGVRKKLSIPAQLSSVPELAKLPDLPKAALASSTRLVDLPDAGLRALAQLTTGSKLPSLLQLPSLPQLPSRLQLPSLPQPPSLPQLPSLPRPLGLSQARTPVLTRTVAPPSAPATGQPLMLPTSAQAYPLPPASATLGQSGVTKLPAAQAQPGTAPIPASPRQPGDFSTTSGQARDSGGGNAPAMGTVSSSWRPEVAAAGRRLATDLITRGRTSRYAGPPS